MNGIRPPSFRSGVLLLPALLALAGTARAAQPVASFTWTAASPTSGNQISFTDTSTENPTSWLWNFGDPAAGFLNTSTSKNPAFLYSLPGTYTVTLTVANNVGSATTSRVLTVTDAGSSLCQETDNTLCVNGGRFSVTAEWTKPDATTGLGRAVKLTNDSGYFWFFDSANIELVVKVLNGCAITNAYWVFGAGLTNVQVVLKVKDEQTGAIYTSVSAQGVPFAPIQATSAFPGSCPPGPTFTPSPTPTPTPTLPPGSTSTPTRTPTPTPTPTPPAAPTLSSLQTSIFTPRCVGCHGGSNPTAGMNLSAGRSYSNLVNIPATTQSGIRVIPGNPGNSVLMIMLNGGHRNLSASERQQISDWIAAGALNN